MKDIRWRGMAWHWTWMMVCRPTRVDKVGIEQGSGGECTPRTKLLRQEKLQESLVDGKSRQF